MKAYHHKDLKGELMKQALENKDPLQGYLEYGHEYIAFVASHPQYFRIMFSGKFTRYHLCPELKTAGEAAFGALVESIRRCQIAGIFRKEPAEQLAFSAWSYVHGIANLYIDGRFQRPGQPYPTVTELWYLIGNDLLRGLKP